MNESGLWDKFKMSGSVYDYISYAMNKTEVESENERKGERLGAESQQLERER